MRMYFIGRCVQPQHPSKSANQSNEANPWPKISLTGGGEDDRGAGAALLLGGLRDAIVVARRGVGDVDEEDVDQVRDGEEAHGCFASLVGCWGGLTTKIMKDERKGERP